MSAILELKETPQSCVDCPLTHAGYSGDSRAELCYWVHNKKNGRPFIIASDYDKFRHPDCPLKITEDNLRWEIIDLGTTQRITGHRCPKCGDEKYTCKFNYCPNCGVKLLPPMEEA